MFGIGLPEFLLIVAVAVVVIGPKDLPRALYTAGKIIRKLKLLSGDIQKSLDDVIKGGELEEITLAANKPGGENLQFEIERQLVEEESKKKAANA
ncbi:MAG: Sec-independent protein translocase protein TatB [Alphaproteobacteria bacterium]|nr:Sec-independent protein translocase protein TatB [Alphaproteobacteria bacterium]